MFSPGGGSEPGHLPLPAAQEIWPRASWNSERESTIITAKGATEKGQITPLTV